MLTAVSQLFCRTPQPSRIESSTVVVVAAVAKAEFESVPSSHSCGTLSLMTPPTHATRSFHGRVAERLKVIGFMELGNATPSFTTYLLSVYFSAVLPSPNRSYATPNRGEMSFQFGTFFTAGQC